IVQPLVRALGKNAITTVLPRSDVSESGLASMPSLLATVSRQSGAASPTAGPWAESAAGTSSVVSRRERGRTLASRRVAGANPARAGGGEPINIPRWSWAIRSVALDQVTGEPWGREQLPEGSPPPFLAISPFTHHPLLGQVAAEIVVDHVAPVLVDESQCLGALIR